MSGAVAPRPGEEIGWGRSYTRLREGGRVDEGDGLENR